MKMAEPPQQVRTSECCCCVSVLMVENKTSLARCPNVVSLSDRTPVDKTAICCLKMLRRGLMGSPQPEVEVSTTWERVTHTHLCVCVWAVSVAKLQLNFSTMLQSSSFLLFSVVFRQHTFAVLPPWSRRFFTRLLSCGCD